MTRLTVPLLIATLALAGCGGRFSDSGWNPLGWFGGSPRATTLEPEGGYAANSDSRPGIPAITGARWEVLNEGRLLVVTGIGATKGYYDAALITQAPNPTDRLTPDPDGVLRLRFVALPPAADSEYARMAAHPETDTIQAALTLSANVLARVDEVQIAGASNTITIRK